MSQPPAPCTPLRGIPQPYCVLKAATGQRVSIRTPGHAMHPLGMPHQRLDTASAFEFPQLDAAIPARAGEPAAIGGKGQSANPVAMPLECLRAASQPGLLPLPPPDLAREVAAVQPA